MKSRERAYRMEKILYLLDASSYIYRAYHAIKGLTNSKGLPTNASFGFTNMLLKVLKEKNPQYLAVIFDAPGPTFRHNIYKEYKANRPTMPEDLIIQIPYIHKIVEGFNIPQIEMEGFEADDIIATLTRKAIEDGFQVVIISGDKDLFQLINDHVTVWDSMRDKIYDIEEIKRDFDNPPDKLLDIFALMGDSSDNIPGVPGIGIKTASKLIKQYGSIEEILKNLNNIKPKKIKEALKNNIEVVKLSKKLISLDDKVPLSISPRDIKRLTPKNKLLKELFLELEFQKFLKELLLLEDSPFGKHHFLSSIDDMIRLTKEKDLKKISFIPLFQYKNNWPIKIRGISFAFDKDNSYFLQVNEENPKYIIKQIVDLVKKHQIELAVHNIKPLFFILNNEKSLIDYLLDMMVAHYLLHPVKSDHSINAIALDYLKREIHEKKKIRIDNLSPKELAHICGEESLILQRARENIKGELESNGLLELYKKIEAPLIPVLASMEKRGIKIDVNILKRLSQEISDRLSEIEKEIFYLAGEEFNINSPQQLGRILFEKLKLKKGRKTKRGYSTDTSVLTSLKDIHPLPGLVLEYRSLMKLRNSYIDVLPGLINPDTGRVHTSFNQAVTATGRLSSSNPNLQNIPIKGDLGKKIREAFISEPGYLLLSADYSQIELRLLAHFSKDPVLLEAFHEGKDIHTQTAVEVFGVHPNLVTPALRRHAKVINFGIIYGMGPYSLAKELGITPKKAKEYIETYFDRYKGVREFISNIIQEVRQNRVSRTIMGRIRPIPEIDHPQDRRRKFAERTAINSPIQGSAADLIKLAMVRVENHLYKERIDAKMILQVHDELLIEVKEDQVEYVAKIVKEEMEGVYPALEVPLRVEINWGKNWSEAH